VLRVRAKSPSYNVRLNRKFELMRAWRGPWATPVADHREPFSVLFLY